jgi:hypothetical protein
VWLVAVSILPFFIASSRAIWVADPSLHDHLHGDAAGFWFVEGAGGVAVEKGIGLLVGKGFDVQWCLLLAIFLSLTLFDHFSICSLFRICLPNNVIR